MKRLEKPSALCRIKRMAVLFMLLFVCFGLTAAASNDRKVVDEADLLVEKQEEKLQELFERIAEEYQCDVVLLTVDSCSTTDFQGYTKNFYLNNEYGYGDDRNGIILMITMKERKFQLTTTGAAEDIFTNYGLQVIDDEITGDLSDGEYYSAFYTYGTLVEEFIRESRSSSPFDNDHQYKQPMPMAKRVLISLASGAILAIVIVLFLLRQLKSVGIEKEAQQYVRDGSFHVTRSNDLYLYTSRTRRKIEKSSSSHGSSGSSSGGHTGSF